MDMEFGFMIIKEKNIWIEKFISAFGVKYKEAYNVNFIKSFGD